MSRVGKKPVVIPSGVKVEFKQPSLTVTGPKGTLTIQIHPKVLVTVTDSEVTVDVAKQTDKKERALWGLSRALIQNLVDGVVKGFEKKLEVNGVGFKVEMNKVAQAKEAYAKKREEGVKQGKAGQVTEAEYSLKRLAQLQGQVLEMRLGFSHPIFAEIPEDVSVVVEKNVITITGADKQRVGQFAAEVRELKKPEPYKGKGIKYIDEVIQRKAGKVVKVVGGGK